MQKVKIKTSFVLSLVGISILFCGGCSTPSTRKEIPTDKATDQPVTSVESERDGSSNSDLESIPEGLKLIQESDCSACHMERGRLVGPSYQEIAMRYEGSYEEEKSRLVETVVEGGSGQWGEVLMSAHPQHTAYEVSLMLDYIFSLSQ